VSPRKDQCILVTRESAVIRHETRSQLLPLSPQRQQLAVGASVLDVIKAGDGSAIDAMLASGLDTSIKDGKGWTVLHAAAWHRKHDIIRKLLTARSELNVDVRTDAGLTPLHLACTRNPDYPLLSDDITASETAQLLVDRGASVNAKTRDGQTAVTLAIASMLKGCVLVLAGVRGLDWAVVDEFGKSPVEIAAGTGNTALLAVVKTAAPPANADAISVRVLAVFLDRFLRA
jgi:ankyrin repeat protein